MKRSIRWILLGALLLLMLSPAAWGGKGDYNNPDTISLGEEYVWDWYSSDACYMRVYVESTRPLVVELDPINADFDLEVWGADGNSRDPYESSNNGGTSRDRVVIDTSEDYWYMIKVTPYNTRSGSFRIRTYLQGGGASGGGSDPLSTSEWNAWEVYLGDVNQYTWRRSQAVYFKVYVESTRPLVVELDPVNADFDLEVWGADDSRRDPYASSNNGGTQTDRVVLNTREDYWYTIKITPYDDSGGSFYLSTYLN